MCHYLLTVFTCLTRRAEHSDGAANARAHGHVAMTCQFNGMMDSKRPKMGLDILLCNVAAMLAGVGAGCDIRYSGVPALQARVQPRRYTTRHYLIIINFTTTSKTTCYIVIGEGRVRKRMNGEGCTRSVRPPVEWIPARASPIQ